MIGVVWSAVNMVVNRTGLGVALWRPIAAVAAARLVKSIFPVRSARGNNAGTLGVAAPDVTSTGSAPAPRSW